MKLRAFISLLLLPTLLTGCGLIADKDLIKIAKVDDRIITRGDLWKILRDMEDNERPVIHNKLDLLRVLNQIIDDHITMPLGKQLASEGKIAVSRDVAREQYFLSKDEKEAESMRFIYNFDENTTTSLMEVYEMTPEMIRARKDVIELKTDEIVEKMQAQQAVAYLAAQEFKAGTLVPNEETVKREYEMRKEEFVNFEWMSFRSFRFPTTRPDAVQQAAAVRNRLDSGESWDQLENEYLLKDPGVISESEIENNPALVKFEGFWQAATGAQPGDILGPVFLPEYQTYATDAAGRPQPLNVPEAYLVVKVLESRPQAVKTIEEARPFIVPQVMVAQEMEKLRKDHGVEIYEDNLFDPSRFVTKDNPLNF